MATAKQQNSWVKKLLNTASAAKKSVSDTISGAKGTVSDYKSAYNSNKRKNKTLRIYTDKKAKEHMSDMKDGIRKNVVTWMDSDSMHTSLRNGDFKSVKTYNARIKEDQRRKALKK